MRHRITSFRCVEARANIGRDPNYLFGALQRQLGYPEVPRPPRVSEARREMEDLQRKMKAIESKLKLLEGEVFGQTDLGFLTGSPPAGAAAGNKGKNGGETK